MLDGGKSREGALGRKRTRAKMLCLRCGALGFRSPRLRFRRL